MDKSIIKDLLRAEINSEYEELEQEVAVRRSSNNLIIISQLFFPLKATVSSGFEELMPQPMRLHVSNIPFSFSEAHLKNLLEVSHLLIVN